jgi:excisionase family DNA binding protein
MAVCDVMTTIDLFVQQIAKELAARVVDQLEITPAPTWKLLTAADVATRLGRSESWVRERARTGSLPHVQLDGGSRRFLPDDVEAYARARRVPVDRLQPLAPDRLARPQSAAPEPHRLKVTK